MHLTPEEEKILNNEEGFAKQRAMEILVDLGKANNADKLIPITSAHVSGGSYKSLGKEGMKFLQELANNWAKVVVPTTLNPGGISPKMKLPKEFAEKQRVIIDAYKALGVIPTLTCTPYYAGYTPKKGEHVAWAESSAAIYANSVLGAYTNREEGMSALAAALIGKTANYGMHLDENRQAGLTIKVKDKLLGFEDFAALGYYIGTTYNDKIVSFDFSSKPSNENLRGLCAALAVSESIPMFRLGKEGDETVEIGYDEIDTTFQAFNSKLQPDLIAIGCPHSPPEEIKKISRMLKGKKIRENVTFWIFTAEYVRKSLEFEGYEDEIEKAGGQIITGACISVAPLEELGFKCMATNSAKAAHYCRSLCNVETKLMSLDEMIKYSLK